MRVEDLTKSIDHLVLAPATSMEEVERACQVARDLHVASLCALPYMIPTVAEALRGSDVKACAAIGYPLGGDTHAVKVAAAEQAVADGAGEIEIVMNVPALVSGEFTFVRDELRRIIRAVQSHSANSSRGAALVKVIVEAPMLDDKLLRLACKIVADAGADFATTCTGYGGAATTLAVEIMRDALPEQVGVKAAGGVRTFADVDAMVAAGAARVGTSLTAEIAAELTALNEQSS